MASVESRLAALERELAALRRQAQSGPGATTQYGATYDRPWQVGFLAKLTSAYNATTGYDWSSRVVTDGTAVTSDASPALTGTHAIEVSGRTDLASGTKVWLEPDPSGRGFLFTVSDTGGVLTVKEVDGAPSISNVTEFRFDQTDGFVVSNPAANVARVDMASASSTQAGVVDTASQSWAGDKTFDNDIYNTTGTMYAGAVLTVGTLAANYNNAYYTPIFYVCDGFADGGGSPIYVLDVYSNNAYTTTADRVLKVYGGTGTTTKPGELEINGVIQFAGISDANAPNSSLYYSTTASKLVWKDSGGTVNNLY